MDPELCLLPSPSCCSFIAKDFHRQETYRRASRQDRCGDRNSHRHDGNPHAIENAGMKRDVRDGIKLRIKRNQMVIPCDEGKCISDEETDQRTCGADADSLPKKDGTNLLAARAERAEHGNVSGFI